MKLSNVSTKDLCAEIQNRFADLEEARNLLTSSSQQPSKTIKRLTVKTTKRVMSASARKRIAQAQKERWKAYHAKVNQQKKAA